MVNVIKLIFKTQLYDDACAMDSNHLFHVKVQLWESLVSLPFNGFSIMLVSFNDMINQNEKPIFSPFTRFQHFDNLECKYFLKGIGVKPFGGFICGVICCNLNAHFLTTWNPNAPFCKF
jgi:hypothetical protein